MPDQPATAREELLQRLLSGQQTARARTIEHHPLDEPAPASPLQESLWFLEQLTAGQAEKDGSDHDRTPYNMGIAMWIDVDLAQVQKAVDVLVARHAALRTYLVFDGELRQRIDPHAAVSVCEATLPEDPATRRRTLRDELARRFDLTSAPLLRCTRYAYGAEGVLLVTLHHAAGDGTSMGILVEELTTLLAGGNLPAAPPQTPSDIARWQRARLEEPRAAERLDSWLNRLRDAAPLDLAGPETIEASPGTHGHASTFTLSQEVTEVLRDLATRLRCSPFAIAMATLQTTLRWATGRPEISIATPIDLRDRWNLAGVVGCLVNTVLIHGHIDTATTFSDVIRSAAETINAAQNDAETPFESIVAALSADRGHVTTPLCNVALARQSLPSGTNGPRWAEMEPTAAQFPLSCHWMESDSITEVTLISDPATVDARRCADLAALWERVIHAALSAPDTPINQLDLTADTDLGETGPVTEPTTDVQKRPQLHELFLRSPEELLVVGENRELTVTEFYAVVLAWAQTLHRIDAPLDEPVEVDETDAVTMQQVILGAWAAGRSVRTVEPIRTRSMIRLGDQQWPCDEPPMPPEEPVELPGPGQYVWQWSDGSTLHADVLRDALWDLQEHLGAVGPVTPLGTSDPVTILAPLLKGNHTSPLCPGRRPRHAVGRAAELVTLSAPPKHAVVTGPITDALGRWADAHGVELVSSMLCPTAHLMGTRPGLVDVPSEGTLHVTTEAGVRLPAGCPGRLWLHRTDGGAPTPWHAIVDRADEIRWWEPTPQAWPNPSRGDLAEQLGVPADHVEQATTTTGVLEFAALASADACRRAARELGLPTMLVRPLTELEDGSRVVIDEQLAQNWRDRTGGVLAFPDEVGTWHVLRTNDDSKLSWQVGPTRPDGPLFPTALRNTIRQNADRVAVVDPDDTIAITYRELGQRVGTLAHRLLDAGIGRGSVVAVQGSTDVETLVAILAAASVGATYAPLDRAHPRHRREQIVHVLQPDLLIGDVEDLGIPCLPPDPDDQVWELDDLPEPETRPGDLLYVLFTSGSTGAPKGVEIRQAGAANLLAAIGDVLELDHHSVIPAHSTVSFDISVTELLAPLMHGSRIVLCGPTYSRDPQALLDLAARHHVTHLQATATLWRELLAIGGLDPTVVRLATGEPLPRDVSRSMTSGGAQGWNLYGPTETTVYSTIDSIDPTAETVSIGLPLANTTVAVVDEQLAVLPIDVAGELVIGGVGVAQGYRNLPDETAERFVQLPGTPVGSRWYRTGDRAIMRKDGKLFHLGRADGQVKVRGNRVEIGDVERALEDDPAVGTAVVDLVGDQLVALVQPTDDATQRRAAWPRPEHPDLVDDVTGLSPTDDARLARGRALWDLVMEEFPEPATAHVAVVGKVNIANTVDERITVTVVDEPEELPGSFDVIVATVHQYSDQAELAEHCAVLAEHLTVSGRLILPDVLEPAGSQHAAVAAASEADLEPTSATPRPALTIDGEALAAGLGLAWQRRPRRDPSTLGDFRADLVLGGPTPTTRGPLLLWNDLGEDPYPTLAAAPRGTIVCGVPDGRRGTLTGWTLAPTPIELASRLPERWRIHADADGLVLAADGAVPAPVTAASRDPWLTPDPALAHWAEQQLDGIRERLGDRLPEYMIPSQLHAVAEFSRTTSFKIDRRRTKDFWSEDAPDRPAQTPAGTWISYFTDQVTADPHAPALDTPTGICTRAELAKQVDALARRLLDRGVQPGNRVIIALPRGSSFVVALLAVLRVRGVFVPLDITQPKARLQMVIADAHPTLVLVQSTDRPAAVGEDLPTMAIDEAATPDEVDLPDPSTIPPDEAAYVVFTSGSTGRPKGVEVSHRGLATLLAILTERLHAGPQRRVLQFAAVGFDAFIWELTASLLSGGTLVMRPPEHLRPGPDLLRALTDLRITDALIQPSVLAVLGEPDALPEELTILAGGEALTTSIVAAFGDRVRLFNAYGPTECTVISHLSAQLHPGDTPVIGTPAPGLVERILDDQGDPVPTGGVGELAVGGRSLALGYLDRPDLTAERFVAAPDDPDLRLYRTGDLVRDTGAGLVYLGRTDDQVKIRGFRVEPGETEAILAAFPEVENAVVLPVMGREPHLEAFVRAAAGRTIVVEDLMAALATCLPAPMTPSQIHVLPEWPLTANGKIDRRDLVRRLRAMPMELGLLQHPDALVAGSDLVEHPVTDRHGRPTRALRRETDQDPMTCTAGKLAELFAPEQRTTCHGADDLRGHIRTIWEATLGRGVPDDQTDFFKLGGHSLRAAEVVRRLRGGGHNLTVADFFAHPTIESLVGLLRGRRRTITDAELIAATRLADDIRPDLAAPMDPVRTAEPKHILVTGATGFLGPRVVIDLLEHTNATVHCLVRGTSPDAARERLNTRMARFGLSYTTERLDVLNGDLQEPYLGLSAEQWNALCRDCDLVLHMGASVNLLDSFDHMMRPNMTGTTELLRLASTVRLKAFQHISTISVVLGKALEQYDLTEDMRVAPSSVLRSGYAMTKWGAEELVLQARERGLPANILRLSRVAQDRQTGTHNPQDAQLLFLRAGVLIGSYPDSSPEFAASPSDAVPVDDLAEWIRVLMLHTSEAGGTYHLISPKPSSMGDFGHALRDLGFALRSVSLNEWTEELAAASDDGDATVRASSELRNMSASLPELGAYHLHASATFDKLAQAGVVLTPIDDALLARHLRQLIDVGFLPTPPTETHV